MIRQEMCRKLAWIVDSSGLAETSGQAYAIAEYLLDNGVMLKEKQKPMSEREVFDRTRLWDIADHVIWMEENVWGDEPLLFVCEISWHMTEECYVYYMCGNKYDYTAYPDGYGKTWRCWAERPTDAEREATEWEG